MNYLTTGKVILGLTLMLLTTGIQAQPGTRMHAQQRSAGDSGMYRHAIPNLTADQKQKIDALRVAHMKDMNAYRNDLAIKKAELQKYKTSDKPDMVLINKTIDDMGQIRTDMQKKLVSSSDCSSQSPYRRAKGSLRCPDGKPGYAPTHVRTGNDATPRRSLHETRRTFRRQFKYVIKQHGVFERLVRMQN